MAKSFGSRLTVLLPLRGRPLFTLRFLWHANACRLPYHFLIADGKVEPSLAEMLQNSDRLFPNLHIEYVKYPDDIEFRDYYAKMHDALGRVRTPYVVFADNDDFLVASGIEQSLSFLEERNDYVCCGGGIGGFSVYGQQGKLPRRLVGPFNKLAFRYEVEDRSLDLGSDSVAERLLAGRQYSWGYYAVYRTETLRTTWREVLEIDFSDLMLLEWFSGLRTLTLGKARSDASVIGYMRQYWTSMRSSFSDDWVNHLLRSRFSSDFATMMDRLSGAVSETDGCDRAEFDETLRRTFDEWFRKFLLHNYGPSGALRSLVRARAPALLTWLKQRRRYSVPRERRTLFKRLTHHGAYPGYLPVFKQELSEIEAVLTHTEFAGFVRRYASGVRTA